MGRLVKARLQKKKEEKYIYDWRVSGRGEEGGGRGGSRARWVRKIVKKKGPSILSVGKRPKCNEFGESDLRFGHKSFL